MTIVFNLKTQVCYVVRILIYIYWNIIRTQLHELITYYYYYTRHSKRFLSIKTINLLNRNKKQVYCKYINI